MSDGLDGIVALNASIGRRAAEQTVGDIEAKVKASMRAVLKENFMETRGDDPLFRAAIGGALMALLNTDEYSRLEKSLDALRKFSAALNAAQVGVPVDFSSLAEAQPNDTLPLMGWWHEVKDET